MTQLTRYDVPVFPVAEIVQYKAIDGNSLSHLVKRCVCGGGGVEGI